MPFVPDSVVLKEAGQHQPYNWLVIRALAWHGTFAGVPAHLVVEASEDDPFTTDLASVPRWLTWLFPRYGTYTKAAVLHDYLCQKLPDTLRDRSDADEVFREAMKELGVPWARRWVMWSAVTWATLFTSLIPGRSSKPLMRWVGRGLAVATVAATLAIALSADWRATAVAGPPLLATGLLIAGFVALGRWDRWSVLLACLGLTMASLPLVAAGAVVAGFLVFYLLFEDAFSAFSAARGRLRRMREEPPPEARTPREERLDAVRAS